MSAGIAILTPTFIDWILKYRLGAGVIRMREVSFNPEMDLRCEDKIAFSLIGPSHSQSPVFYRAPWRCN